MDSYRDISAYFDEENSFKPKRYNIILYKHTQASKKSANKFSKLNLDQRDFNDRRSKNSAKAVKFAYKSFD